MWVKLDHFDKNYKISFTHAAPKRRYVHFKRINILRWKVSHAGGGLTTKFYGTGSNGLTKHSASLSVFIIMRGFNIIHYSSLTLTICRILFAFWDRLLHKIVQVKFGACYYKIESRKQKGVLCLFESWRSQAKEEITSWKSFMKKRLVSILTTSEEASTLLAVWLRAVWQLLYIFGGNICLAHARIGQGHHKSVSWDFCSICKYIACCTLIRNTRFRLGAGSSAIDIVHAFVSREIGSCNFDDSWLYTNCSKNHPTSECLSQVLFEVENSEIEYLPN